MSKKTIIIIDDDVELNEELSEILSDDGMIVESVYDGIKGKKFLENNEYSLVLLDLKMPGINGFDILKHIKVIKPQIKIVVLTGNPVAIPGGKETSSNIDRNKTEILKLADAVINKPFDIDDLLIKINLLLAQ